MILNYDFQMDFFSNAACVEDAATAAETNIFRTSSHGILEE